MAPRPRRDWPAGFDLARLRHAAGLLLVYPVDRQPHIVLTVRAHSLGRHGGQVSLPGGAVDAGETIEQAALREAHEEIGLDSRSVRTLGALTPVDVHVSGFRLHPVVGVSAVSPALSPTDAEVARILDVPLDALLDPASITWSRMTRDGRVFDVPAFIVVDAVRTSVETGRYQVWGATAMILAEFLTMLGWPGPG
jgi:8-oxo-dGTP pyrophosphatase MutT (NUDIX family)